MNWVKEIWDYKDGVLYWKNPPKGIKDKKEPAGYKNSKGYFCIQFNKIRYQRSRLVYYYFNNKWPEPQCDHINMIKTDDRIENLVSKGLNRIHKVYKNKVKYKYIYPVYREDCKNKVLYFFTINKKIIKCSVSLEKLIVFRGEYIKKHYPKRVKDL